jgi:hypothetical protein
VQQQQQAAGRHQSPSQLEATWSAGYPRSPRSMWQRGVPGAGVPAYAGAYDEGVLQGQMGMQGGLPHQQQRLQRPRVDPSAYETAWPEYMDVEGVSGPPAAVSDRVTNALGTRSAVQAIGFCCIGSMVACCYLVAGFHIV